MFFGGRVRQGGSTITQQLVKNYFLTSEKTFKRKITEFAMSFLLEAHASKDEILETYLNVIYLGQNGPFQVRGFGAAATVYIRDGVVIGIAMVASGAGYVSASTSAIITGDGQGAAVIPIVGVPLAQGRRLTLRCGGQVRFTQRSTQVNWTKTDITIPAGGEIVWQVVSGNWQAAWFNNTDYLQPGGDGSVSIKSIAGDIRLQSAMGGGVRFGSDLEKAGFLTSFGRGSPEGVVIAPPGSDYRNLNGGVGMTLWVKQTGSDSSGWSALA